jgi:DNA polymerase-3 subunit epsilon
VHDIQGKVIYIGRGTNIKHEINSLFLKITKRATKIQERANSVSFDKTGNVLFTRLKYYLELHKLKPKFNFIKKIKYNLEPFKHNNFILFDKGREIEEHAVILIENDNVLGYGYTSLAYQENNLDILKSILTPIEDKDLAKTIIKNFIKRNKVQKIIRF